MRIPSFTRIILEDLSSEAQKLVGPLVNPLNNFMLTIKNGLNKGITINDNLSGALKIVNITGNTTSFSYASTRSPKAVILGGWTDVTDSTWVPVTTTFAPNPALPLVTVTVTSGVSINWTYADGDITITFYGFNSAHKYTVSLVIFDD
jgi:hypothetical protein